MTLRVAVLSEALASGIWTCTLVKGNNILFSNYTE